MRLNTHPPAPGASWAMLLPAAIALIQGWAAHRVTLQVPAGPITDGIHFINHARAMQEGAVPLLKFLDYGLYTAFLSLFDLKGVSHWATAAAHPKILAVYAAQTLLLGLSTVIFLALTLRLAAGPLAWRAATAGALGLLLLSPLTVVWPSALLTEALAFPVVILFLGACLAYDAQTRNAAPALALACCALILARDPLILFVWMFLALLCVNLLRATRAWTRRAALGAALLLAAIGFGAVKMSVAADGSKVYSQLLANIIQLRILPDPQRRAFFVARGMPANASVMERAGKPAWYKNSWFMSDAELRDDPDFIAYRDWVLRHGTRVYAQFLMSHPGYVLRSMVRTPNLETDIFARDFRFSLLDLFATPYPAGYYTDATPYPPWLQRLLLAPFGWLACALYFVAIAIGYLRQTLRRQPASALDTAALAAFPALFLTYHMDAMDLWRHAAPLLLIVYIALTLRIAALAWDAVVAARARFAAAGASRRALAADEEQIARPAA